MRHLSLDIGDIQRQHDADIQAQRYAYQRIYNPSDGFDKALTLGLVNKNRQ